MRSAPAVTLLANQAKTATPAPADLVEAVVVSIKRRIDATKTRASQRFLNAKRNANVRRASEGQDEFDVTDGMIGG